MANPITPATPGTLPDVTDPAGLTLDMTNDALGREYRLTQNGWKICSSNNVIKGITFTAITTAYALSLDASGGGGCQTTVSNNLIELNDFGTYRNDSSTEAANNLGILITSGATNNTIQNNFIVNRAAAQPAIRITGATTTGNIITNNLIGVNRTGTAAFAKPNAYHGAEITGGAKNNIVGPGNIISGNGGSGVFITGAGTTGNQVYGNKIGVDTTGVLSIPNTGNGVLISAGASSNVIGSSGNINYIGFNSGTGVVVDGATTINNTIRNNSIFNNTGIAIDLTSNGNNNVAAPTIVNYIATGVGVYRVWGTSALADGTTIDVYQATNAANPSVSPDPSGAGEAFVYLCSTTVSGGNWEANGCPSSAGNTLTAIATTASGNSSKCGTNKLIINLAPVADAGDDDFIPNYGVLVQLDGTGSSDPNMDPLTYKWTQTAGPAVTLSSDTSAQPTFTPSEPGDYVFELVVNDGFLFSSPDSVTIVVNYPPVADAGTDQNIVETGILVELDGTGSYDVNGHLLTYLWDKTSGPAATLSSYTEAKPTFTPATCGDYTFQLIVNDSYVNSAPDSVTITVNCVPVANAGLDQFPSSRASS